ncbi:unnamed protein product [Rotaria magnacalcarata]|uniref:Uncharacterized protein n=1 Tax=Rotaria magnacalcarata TaxID=392030 RepID=A0A819U3Y2_9BILA|nr:unnamed protein product [Rotaria magnacalcarata]CAF4088423.1 unnamed protein product [Rotaria magnacalcarata]
MQSIPPPPQLVHFQHYRGDSVYRDNRYNYQYYGYNNNPNHNNNMNNFNRRKDIAPNQNFQQRFNINNGYRRNQYSYQNSRRGTIIGPLGQTEFIRNKKTSRSTSRQRQLQQRCTSGPRQRQLNDFMPPLLRDASPVNALLQTLNFITQAIRTNDTTQPFEVNPDLNENENVNEQQPKQQKKNQSERLTTNTASNRRRQR